MDSSSKSDASQTDNDKLRLECNKIAAETDAIRRPFWKTSSFFAAMSPTFLAIAGLAFTWGSGWFDVQRTRVNNERLLVQAETERLKTERIDLARQATEQRAYAMSIDGEVQRLRQERSILTNQLALLSKERAELQTAKRYFESEAKRLSSADTNSARMLGQLQAAQADRENLSYALQEIQATNAALKVYTARQTKMISWANDMISTASRLALEDRKTYPRFQTFLRDAWRFHADSFEYLPEWQTDEFFDKHPELIHLKSYETYISEAQNRIARQQTNKSDNIKTLPNDGPGVK